MMESSTFWEDSTLHQHVKFESYSSTDGGSSQACKEEQSIFRYCDGNLNFSTVATSEDDEYGSYHKKKVSRDPMSHRIIEKRRRDRMNNCLADLSRLIPADYLKKGRGRIEKTEIIEMAIKHMKHLQAHACRQLDTCELVQQQNQEEASEQHPTGGPIVIEHYRLGYQECLSEAMHFLVEVEGFFAGDPLCVQLINHLQKHCDKILKGDRLNFPRTHHGETTSTSSNSSGGGSYNNRHSSIIPSGLSGFSSGSPNSGSCSDSGRTDNKDVGIATSISAQTIPATENGEDGYCEDSLLNINGPSQLREMLTSSNLTSLQTSQATTIMTRTPQTSMASNQLLQRPSSPVHSTSSAQYSSALGATSSSTDQSGGNSAAALYKFKNNIKQRFTAEHHVEDISSRRHHDDPPVPLSAPTNDHSANNCSAGIKRKRYSVDPVHEHISGNSTVTLSSMANVKRRDSETCSIPSSPPSPPLSKYPPPSPSPDLANNPSSPLPPPLRSLSNPSYGVPIFALHSKGSFYIPLTLDAEILAPYLAAIGFGSDVNGVQNGNSMVSGSVVLHPVTISVNFQQSNYHRVPHHHQQHSRQQHMNNCSSVTTWKNELNCIIPMPKWSVFSPDRN
ncbi:transcription factor cwo isoform X2 [Periplaneta americana]|uniref:transcription factor cwo isoform X2 n=1 Tax=Periplaneta americana TaxID=6978 RepID=UPI0037E85A64